MGIVNQDASSTFDIVGPDEFNISYVDGSGSAGDYFQDTFKIGGATLTQFQMGLATTTSIGTGIMGIGYNTSEANLGTGNGTVYPNLPVAMVNQGVINSAAYSLWLNDLRKFCKPPRRVFTNIFRIRFWVYSLRWRGYCQVHWALDFHRCVPHRSISPHQLLHCSIDFPLRNQLFRNRRPHTLQLRHSSNPRLRNHHHPPPRRPGLSDLLRTRSPNQQTIRRGHRPLRPRKEHRNP